ncbi:MAG: DUF3892 domain-containing protein [Candidatus Manganitrophus sp.]|nr:DUF3892 domain-containing protein [Candidatus Manganitrophus sp.]MDC4224984.1 DUF3892 domain-containing protein [Candidatus Manganitrophus sp.]WDT69488.1 MAG: DUF3892 domain-containing protein [Candidatus Manganitrophus sp.]WDT78921.1 MAG: DUF3892 domain-containing protein [Candidatus Manganitrophus sp.]
MVRITCITKQGGYHEDPHHAIEKVGWIDESDGQRGISTRLQMYDFIENKKGAVYVKDQSGNTVYVGTAISAHGTKYIRTYADKVWTNNLLALSECS